MYDKRAKQGAKAQRLAVMRQQEQVVPQAGKKQDSGHEKKAAATATKTSDKEKQNEKKQAEQPPKADGYYYSATGELLAAGKKSKHVYVAAKKDNAWDYEHAVKLSLDHDEFVKFAGVIHVESGGDKLETYAIGNAIVNASNNGGQSITYLIGNNNFTKAINNSKFTAYTKAPTNDKFALGGTVNALLRAGGDSRGIDYSKGAVMWEGGELAAKGEKQHKPSFYGTSISNENWDAFSDYWTKNKKALNKDYGKDKVADLPKQEKDAKSHELKATSKGANNGKILLKSTIVYGGTIFFGPNKTEANKDYAWKYLSIYNK